MITQYKVVHSIYKSSLESAQYRAELEDEVNRLIEEGWQPYGSLVASSNRDESIFLQPMVKTAESSSGIGGNVIRQVDTGRFG